MPFFDRNPLEYPANGFDPIRRWKDTRAPTTTDYKQFKVSDEWLDQDSNDWWKLCYKDATQGIWAKMCGTSAASEQFLVSTGTSPVIPNATNQITLVDGNGVGITGGLNQWTTNMVSPFTGDFNFQNDTAATALALGIVNNDTDATSSASLNIESQDGGGDAFVHFYVNATQEYSFGQDNSDSDYLKLTNGSSPSAGDTLWIFYPTGSWTNYGYSANQIYENIGARVEWRTENTDGTNIASNCVVSIRTADGGGDPFVEFVKNAPAPIVYGLGIDQTDDKLKIVIDNTFTSPSAGTELMFYNPVDPGAGDYSVWSFHCPGNGTSNEVSGYNGSNDGHRVTWSIYNGGVGLLSDAVLDVRSLNADAWISLVGGFDWIVGGATGDSNQFRIGHGSPPTGMGAGCYFQITTPGEVTMPLQPAFLATHTVAQNNVTGNSTVATVNFTTEVFDQNSDYDGTNLFTAPVTGRYQFNTTVRFDDLGATSTNGTIRIVTSNRTYQAQAANYGAIRQTTANPNAISQSFSVLADMDSGDTAYVVAVVGGMAGDTVDFVADATGTYFSGKLEC